MKEKIVKFSHKHWLLVSFVFLFLLSIIIYFSQQVYIDAKILGLHSYTVKNANDTAFSLYTTSGYLYKSSLQHQDAALDFIKANPNKIFGSGLTNTQNVSLQRSVVDKQNSIDYSPGTEHYFYQQMVDNIPVYNGIIAVHIRHADEVYASSGVVITQQPSIIWQKITAQQAQAIAIQQAEKEQSKQIFSVSETKEYLLNLHALGLKSDDNTYHVLAVLVTAGKNSFNFSTRYFVDLNSGKIVYQENQIENLLSRNISNCKESDNCVLSRSEGDPASSDSDVNKLYNIFGQVYNFYHNNFGRDSVDNHGAALNGYVHRIDIAGYPCPNAAYVDGGIQVCDGMDVLDIITHELTHAVTHYTAGLTYSYQSGALNESNSDIFATALDHNWTIGEDVHITGVKTPFRYLDNPPLAGQPDKLFSTLYACGDGDSGGLHTNEGVMNKAFYLMTMGGNFNGCQIKGIGNSSYQIQYRTLTHYLTPSANFTDMYIDMLLACNDLYGGYSDTCTNVQNAMEATELDQQPVDTQTGALCLNRTEATPACSNQSTSIIGVPTPTGSSGQVTFTGSNSDKLSLKVIVYADKNNNNIYDNGEGLANVILSLSSGGQQFSQTTDATGVAAFPSLGFGNLQLKAQLADGTSVGTYTTTVSQSGNYVLQWSVPANLLQQPNTALPPNCQMITKCSHSAGKLQLCTFECK